MERPKLNDHVGLAKHYAQRYAGFLIQYPSLTFDDLLQEALLALDKACKAYDPNMNVKFPWLAAVWMKQAMLKLMATQGGTIRFPRPRKASSTVHEYEFVPVDVECETIADNDSVDALEQKLIRMDLALEQLDGYDRYLISSHYGLGYVEKKMQIELAAELGIKVSTIQNHVARAKARLTAIMNKELNTTTTSNV